MKPYAEGTTVPVARSEAELKDMLRKRGATNIAIVEPEGRVVVQFDLEARRVQFSIPLPKLVDFAHREDKPIWHKLYKRKPEEQRRCWEQACRQKWRALLLGIKAMFSNVDSGVLTFEQAFLPFIVMPDGKTVAAHVLPAIAIAYVSGKLSQPLLGPGGE